MSASYLDRVTEPPARIELLRLTSLRAFAALAVFGFHTGTDLGWWPGRHLLGLGYAGVTFFFVLSGFVLTWATSPTTPARTERHYARLVDRSRSLDRPAFLRDLPVQRADHLRRARPSPAGCGER